MKIRDIQGQIRKYPRQASNGNIQVKIEKNILMTYYWLIFLFKALCSCELC